MSKGAHASVPLPSLPDSQQHPCNAAAAWQRWEQAAAHNQRMRRSTAAGWRRWLPLSHPNTATRLPARLARSLLSRVATTGGHRASGAAGATRSPTVIVARRGLKQGHDDDTRTPGERQAVQGLPQVYSRLAGGSELAGGVSTNAVPHH